MADTKISNLPSGGTAQNTDNTVIQRDADNYKLSLSQIFALFSQNLPANVTSLNALTGAITLAAGSNITLQVTGNTITISSSGGTGGVQSVNAGVAITVTGTSTNPMVNVDVGTDVGQIVQLGPQIKGSASLPGVNADQLLVTDSFENTPPVINPLETALARMAVKIPTTAVQLFNGQQGNVTMDSPNNTLTFTTSGVQNTHADIASSIMALINAAKVTSFNGDSEAITLTPGANITITRTSAGNFTIASTGGSGGVSELNGLVGALQIISGPNVVIDSSGDTITISVQNVNNAATYVDVVLDTNIQLPSVTYNNGNLGVGATLTSNSNGVMGPLDGIAVPQGARIAFINFTNNSSYNGIYILTDLGSSTTPWVLTRAGDFNTIDTMLPGTNFTVKQGNNYGGSSVVFNSFSTTPPVVGTSAANFLILPALNSNVPDGNVMTIPQRFLDIITFPNIQPLTAVWDFSSTPGLTLIYNNGTAGVGATLTNSVNGVIPTIDQMTLRIGDRVAIIMLPEVSENGIYEVTNLGSSTTPWVLTRATDFDSTDNMRIGVTFPVNNSAPRTGPGLFSGALVTLAFEVTTVGSSPIYLTILLPYNINPSEWNFTPEISNKLLPSKDIPIGSILVYTGATDGWQALSQGNPGQFLTSQGVNEVPTWEDDPNQVIEFSWTPIDATGTVTFPVAVGRGRQDGKSIVLDFTIQYPNTASGQYAQIKGWDSSLNPIDITGVGIGSTTTASVSPNGFANQITLLIDRLALRCNGVVTLLSDMSNQFFTGHIEYYLDTSSIQSFISNFKNGKVKKFDKKEYDFKMKSIQSEMEKEVNKK